MMAPSIFPHTDLVAMLDALLRSLGRVQAAGGHKAAKPIPVVVPSIQFTDWLQVSIARRRGICMGYDFMMPQAFMDRILSLGDVPRKQSENPWATRNLVWHLLPHIEQYATRLGVKDPSPSDRLALARLIADQFDQYAHFRPEFIKAWSNGQSVAKRDWRDEDRDCEAWQRELWARVAEALKSKGLAHAHPCLCLASLVGDSAFEEMVKAAFPKLFILGTGAFDPLLVRVLGLVAEVGCDVEAHIVLPSLSYLGEFRKAPPLSNQDPESIEMQAGHPLLVSMGKHAIGSFLLLGQLDENYANWPEESWEMEAAPPTLLGRLQSDIRSLNPTKGSFEIRDDDGSVKVHACFGRRREMEVLRDEILRAFQDLKDLKPEEIMVVTPSLDIYAPFVTAVFGEKLPVRLTELPPAEQDPVAEGLLALLDLARGHGEASALLELLNLRAVRTCLGIADDANALERLRDWVRNSGLIRLQVAGGDQAQGSWQFARNRLIAGEWFGDSLNAIYPAKDFVLPIAEDLGSDIELKQAFLKWHWKVEETMKAWKEPVVAVEWSRRLTHACDQLLSVKEDPDARLGVQSALGFLSRLDSEESLDAAAISDWLASEFTESTRRTLLSGRITFGRFKQLQNLPCRVLAMIGMEDGAFPRRNRTPAWDLLRRDPRAWDRNARIDDRQLFLDALMTPKDRLIITASTRNVRSGNKEPFSSCVDELLRVAGETMRNPRPIVIQHRLQPFASGYFNSDADHLPRSFDQSSACVASAVLGAEAGKPKGIPFWKKGQTRAEELLEPLELTVDQLIQFWKEPAKAFVRTQGIFLGVDDGDDADLDRFPLQLGGLETWSAKSDVVEDVIESGSPQPLTKALLRANRILPPSELGELHWQRVTQQVETLGLKVRQMRKGVVDISCQLQGFPHPVRILGRVLEGTWNGQDVWLSYRVGGLNKARHFLGSWVYAVAAAAAGECRPTCLIAEDNPDTPLLRAAYSAQEATALLCKLVRGFLAGRHRPLCYAPMTSDKYVETLERSGKPWEDEPEGEALEMACSQWESGGFKGNDAEGTTPAALLAWRDQDAFEFGSQWHQWARDVARPLREWFNEQSA